MCPPNTASIVIRAGVEPLPATEATRKTQANDFKKQSLKEIQNNDRTIAINEDGFLCKKPPLLEQF